jgi:hypothetical protein
MRLGLSLEKEDSSEEEEEEEEQEKSVAAFQTKDSSSAPLVDRNDDLSSLSLVSKIFPSETVAMEAPFQTTIPTQRAGITTKFIFLEMLLIQLLVLFSAAVYHQTTHRLTLLPVSESGITTEPNDPILHHHNTTTSSMVFVSNNNNNNNNNSQKEDCIYVPGGGFSGFWFTLGRLSALSSQQIHQDTFVCYSAGCLGVVATLIQHLQQELQQQEQQHLQRHLPLTINATTTSTVSGHQELYAMARGIQLEWLEGSLHRYDVVETFSDRMMDTLTSMSLLQDNAHADSLARRPRERFWHAIQNNLHIVTSKPATTTTTTTTNSVKSRHALLLDATMQRPHDLQSLKRMLLQTTWIPMAVGSSFSHQGHLDGAFTVLQHPSCRRDVGLVVPKRKHYSNENHGWLATANSYLALISDSWKLWSNTLNVNLGKQEVDDLFQMGFDYGV